MTQSKSKTASKRASKLHDYTVANNGWGHSYHANGKQLTGWGYDIEEGDRLLVDTAYGRKAIYRFTHVEYYRDPPDMWTATVEFIKFVPEKQQSDTDLPPSIFK